MNVRIAIIVLLALTPLFSACAGDHATAGGTAHIDAATRPEGESEPMQAPATLPTVTVHKSPSCGCCGLWIEHLREAGFAVEVHDHAPDALNRIKLDLGVPYGKGSCHTAEVGDYFVEGHVPAADVKRLLTEAPDAKGLTLPGMPMGSPGMEVPDGTVQPYVVELVGDDGGTEPFASH